MSESRRSFLKQSSLVPASVLVTGLSLAKLLHDLSKPKESDWREKIKAKLTGEFITTDSLIDLVDSVLEQRGLS